ncbi:hypothetical protein EDD18DRAFT_1108037 [Armillaria luteobubalina]|uniref:Uncharacterized protein n=1 Tax=Armillaria luteobubalina TaxID=153913 RepID=A0AA39PZX5_9AGAR|nr:hypothetical protein EDD18DRAFT_1108037 [Armillaria luteobubalina]
MAAPSQPRHRDGLQTRDLFFGNQNQINMCSASLGNEYPAKILLEAKRRKMYHYTLHGYNGAGWMTITLEMEASNNDGVFPYGQQHWNSWLAQAGIMLRCGQAFHIIPHLRTDAMCAISSDPDESLLGDNVVDYPWAYLTSVVAATLCYPHHWFITNRTTVVVGDAPYREGLKKKEGCDRGEA